MIVEEMKTAPGRSPKDLRPVSVCQWESLRHRRGSISDYVSSNSHDLTSHGLPLSRHKHAACCVGDYVYVIGGKDRSSSFRDVWQLHIKQREWRQVKLRGTSLPYLQGHTVVVHQRLLLIFGGTFSDSLGDVQLWIFNTDLGHLREVWVEPGSPQPTCRRDHSAVVHNSTMYVYGGFGDTSGSSQEFWAYSIEEEEWTEITTMSHSQPGRRHSHSAVVASNAMWLYGGMCGLAPRADLWQYHFVLHQWQKVKCVGSSPPLSGHTANVIQNHMVLVGGNIQGKPVADVWLFNFSTAVWQKVQTCGTAVLPALCLHASVSYDPAQCADSTSSRTRSTPHLKPAAKYQLQADRFAVRPRSSPPVSSDQHSSVRVSQRRRTSRQTGGDASGRTTDRAKTPQREEFLRGRRGSGDVCHTEESLHGFDSEAGHWVETVNSTNMAEDTRIQVHWKEHLLTPPSPCSSGVTLPFLRRVGKYSVLQDEGIDEDSRGGMTTSVSAPVRLSAHSETNSEEQLVNVKESSYSYINGAVVSDGYTAASVNKNSKCGGQWKHRDCLDDLLIEDLETVGELNGVEDVKISYPSRHPLLPLPFSSYCNTSLDHHQRQHQQQQHRDEHYQQQQWQYETCQDQQAQSVQLIDVYTKTACGFSSSGLQFSPPQTGGFAHEPSALHVSERMNPFGLQQCSVDTVSASPSLFADHQALQHLSPPNRLGFHPSTRDSGGLEAETSFMIFPENVGKHGATASPILSSDPLTAQSADPYTLLSTDPATPTDPVSVPLHNTDPNHVLVISGAVAEPTASLQLLKSHTSGGLDDSTAAPLDGIHTEHIQESEKECGQKGEWSEPCLLVFGGRTEEMGSLHPKPLPVYRALLL